MHILCLEAASAFPYVQERSWSLATDWTRLSLFEGTVGDTRDPQPPVECSPHEPWS